jgi:hypothetical protein
MGVRRPSSTGSFSASTTNMRRKLLPFNPVGRSSMLCSTEFNPLQTLVWNATSGFYDVPDNTINTTNTTASTTNAVGGNTGQRWLQSLFSWTNEDELLQNSEDVSGIHSRSRRDAPIQTEQSSRLWTSHKADYDHQGRVDSYVPHRRLEDPPTPVLYGRQCLCSPLPDTYCPIGAHHCKIAFTDASARRDIFEISCAADSKDSFVRFVVPLMFFFWFLVLCSCVYSPKGAYARGYLQRVVFCWQTPRYEQALQENLDRIVRRNRQRREAQARIRRRTVASHRVVLGRDRPPGTDSLYPPQLDHSRPGRRVGSPVVTHTTDPPTELPPADVDWTAQAGMELVQRSVVVLRTRRYRDRPTVHQSSDHADAAQQETAPHDDVCAICLNAFADADRVGDLQCQHVFHVDCLKSWIQHKNHCPLCKADDLATPPEAPRSSPNLERPSS